MLAGFLKGLERDSYLISDKFTPQCADASSKTAMKDMVEMQLGLMGLEKLADSLGINVIRFWEKVME